MLTFLRNSMLMTLSAPRIDVDSVLTAAQYTVSFVRAVGQEASPSKCVSLGTSEGC